MFTFPHYCRWLENKTLHIVQLFSIFALEMFIGNLERICFRLWYSIIHAAPLHFYGCAFITKSCNIPLFILQLQLFGLSQGRSSACPHATLHILLSLHHWHTRAVQMKDFCKVINMLISHHCSHWNISCLLI